MNSLQLLKYILSRIGILLALVLFSAFIGKLLFPFIASFVPSDWGWKESFIQSQSGSIFGYIVMLAFLVRIFYDDGKRQSAYDSWSSINITIVLLLMFFVYFIPSIFRDSFSAEGKGELFYDVLYYPCHWFESLCSVPLTVGILGSMGLLVVLLFITYVTAYKLYTKKHPCLIDYSHLSHKEENADD